MILFFPSIFDERERERERRCRKNMNFNGNYLHILAPLEKIHTEKNLILKIVL